MKHNFPSQNIVEFDGEQHFDPDTFFSSNHGDTFEMKRNRDIEKAKLVINEYKCRMIRLSYKTLKCDREEVKKLYEQAIERKENLLYIDVDNLGVLFVSPTAERYEWLTSQINPM